MLHKPKLKLGFFLLTLFLLFGSGLNLWGGLAAPHALTPFPLWTAESDEAEANLSHVAFGDFNGDGYADLVALAPDASHPEVAEGLIMAWYGGSEGLGAPGTVANAAWTAETDQAGAHLATVVSGDVNGDGYDDAIAASMWFSNGELNEGTVFVWEGSSTGLGGPGTQENADWKAESNVVVGLFGTSLSLGDFNGDGYADLAIGASALSNGQTSEGRVFVYLGSSGGLGVNGTPANADWTSESHQVSAAWGSALATGDFNGDGYADLAIGAARYDQGQTDEGAVFVYFGSSGGLGVNGAPVNADWSAQSDQAGANLGSGLAAGRLDGDGDAELVISALAYDDPYVDEPDEGLVLVYGGGSSGLGANGTPTNATWRAQGNQEGAFLGSALAVGDLNADGQADVLVGAHWYDQALTNEGAAFGWYSNGSDLGSEGAPSNADWSAYAEQAHAWFGQAVAVGDVYGPDGAQVLAVGAPEYDNGETGEGAIWLFGSAPTGCPLGPEQDCEATPTPEPTLPPAPTPTLPPASPFYLYLPLLLHP